MLCFTTSICPSMDLLTGKKILPVGFRVYRYGFVPVGSELINPGFPFSNPGLTYCILLFYFLGFLHLGVYTIVTSNIKLVFTNFNL